MFDRHREPWFGVEFSGFSVASADLVSVELTLNGVSLRDGWVAAYDLDFNPSMQHTTNCPKVAYQLRKPLSYRSSSNLSLKTSKTSIRGFFVNAIDPE